MRELHWASEEEIVRALELLQEVPAELSDKAMGSVHIAIASGDMIELGTSVMVREFILPMLDMLAFALGLPAEGE